VNAVAGLPFSMMITSLLVDPQVSTTLYLGTSNWLWDLQEH